MKALSMHIKKALLEKNCLSTNSCHLSKFNIFEPNFLMYMFNVSTLYRQSIKVSKILLYDWRESCLLIGPISLHKSLCLPGNWSEPVHKLILHENQLELVSRS